MTMLDMRPRTDSAPPSLRRDPPLQLPPGNTFVRYIATLALAQIERSSPQEIATRMWPSDLVLRAATAPAMTSTAGWAAELVQTMVADGLRALGPASAGAQVLERGLVLSFEGHGTISAPGLVVEYGNAGFVGEGKPIPVRQLTTTASTLLPHKLAAIGVLTREMVESSNAEALIADALMRAAISCGEHRSTCASASVTSRRRKMLPGGNCSGGSRRSEGGAPSGRGRISSIVIAISPMMLGAPGDGRTRNHRGLMRQARAGNARVCHPPQSFRRSAW